MTNIKHNLEITRTELNRSWTRIWKAQKTINTIPGQNHKEREKWGLLNELLCAIELAQNANDKAFNFVINNQGL